MREICGNTYRAVMLAALAFVCSATPTLADNNSFYQSNTQYGVSLPNAALPSGSDEIHAADGTSCRSAVGGDGAYLDMGVIAAPGGNGVDKSGTIYSRVVMPLGAKPRRLDCGALYDLEIQRLKAELQLARMGLASGNGGVAVGTTADEAWSTEGANQTQAAAVPSVKKKTASKKAAVKVTPTADAPVGAVVPSEQPASLY